MGAAAVEQLPVELLQDLTVAFESVKDALSFAGTCRALHACCLEEVCFSRRVSCFCGVNVRDAWIRTVHRLVRESGVPSWLAWAEVEVGYQRVIDSFERKATMESRLAKQIDADIFDSLIAYISHNGSSASTRF